MFVRELGERLFPPPTPRRKLALRPVFAGGLLAGGLAVVALLLALAGTGPLADGDHAGQARSNCRYVTVHEKARVPVVIERAGKQRIVYRSQLVTRHVQRCG